MNENIIKENFNASILFIGAVLEDLGFNYEFWDKKTAAVDLESRTFYFPRMALELSDKALDLIWGFVWHELGHALFTDPKALKSAVELGGLTENVYRVLEDVWQEIQYNQATPYSFVRLEKLTHALIKDNLLGASSDKTPPTVLVTNYLLNYGYSELVSHSGLKEFTASDEELMVNTFGKALVVRIKSILNTIRDCESSLDVLSVTQLITQAFKDERDSPTPPNSTDNKDGEGNKSQSDSSRQSSGNSDSSEQSSGSECQEETSGGSEKNSVSSSDVNAEPSNGTSTAKPEQTCASAAIQQVLEARSNEFGKADRGEILQPSLSSEIQDSGSPFRYNLPKPPVKFGVDQQFIARGEAVASGLIPRFKRLFESQNKKRKSRHSYGHKLARNCSIKLMVNDPNIFIRKRVKKAVNTHISIALDDSGSMQSDDKNSVSIDAINAIGLAIERTKGVSVSACAFPSRLDEDSVDVICTADESFSSITSRFNNINAKGSSTPMANGILWSMGQCARAKEPRKIIIVLTDGSPNSGHREFVKEMVAKCKLHGVEIWGIGIKCDRVKAHFDKYIVINDIQSLPAALMEKLTQVI